eukprot:4083728-Prymnesium_polylepis.2
MALTYARRPVGCGLSPKRDRWELQVGPNGPQKRVPWYEYALTRKVRYGTVRCPLLLARSRQGRHMARTQSSVFTHAAGPVTPVSKRHEAREQNVPGSKGAGGGSGGSAEGSSEKSGRRGVDVQALFKRFGNR